MEQWKQIDIILCSFGLFQNFQPSAPFDFQLKTYPNRNVTAEQYDIARPWVTNSQLIHSFIFMLALEMLHYQPIMILMSLLGIVIGVLLMVTKTFESLMIIQVLIGSCLAAEVAYCSYIYNHVERSKFMAVSSHVRASTLISRFLACVVSQCLVLFKIIEIPVLSRITFAAQCLCLMVAIYLPAVKSSLYKQQIASEFERLEGKKLLKYGVEIKNDQFDPFVEESISFEDTIIDEDNNRKHVGIQTSAKSNQRRIRVKSSSLARRLRIMFILLRRHFVKAYSNLVVVEWSIWWILATCGFALVLSNIHVMWHYRRNEFKPGWNAGAEALLLILSTIATIAVGFIRDKSTAVVKYDNRIWILPLCAAIATILALILGLVRNVWIAYLVYAIIGMLYHFIATYSSGIIATALVDESYGLIFSINTFLAVFVEVLINRFWFSGTFISLTPSIRFFIITGYFGAYSILYSIWGLLVLCGKWERNL